MMKEVKLSVTELVEEFDSLIWEQGKDKFKVQERFESNKKTVEKELIVYGIKAEVDMNDCANVLMISDLNDNLLNNSFVSAMIILDTIRGIHKITIAGEVMYYIDLAEGAIYITVL